MGVLGAGCSFLFFLKVIMSQHRLARSDSGYDTRTSTTPAPLIDERLLGFKPAASGNIKRYQRLRRDGTNEGLLLTAHSFIWALDQDSLNGVYHIDSANEFINNKSVYRGVTTHTGWDGVYMWYNGTGWSIGTVNMLGHGTESYGWLQGDELPNLMVTQNWTWFDSNLGLIRDPDAVMSVSTYGCKIYDTAPPRWCIECKRGFQNPPTDIDSQCISDCICPNGNVADGEVCFAGGGNGSEVCTACNSGFTLNGHVCLPPPNCVTVLSTPPYGCAVCKGGYVVVGMSCGPIPCPAAISISQKAEIDTICSEVTSDLLSPRRAECEDRCSEYVESCTSEGKKYCRTCNEDYGTCEKLSEAPPPICDDICFGAIGGGSAAFFMLIIFVIVPCIRRRQKQAWSAEEDFFLQQVVRDIGPTSWDQVADRVTKYNGKTKHSANDCRARHTKLMRGKGDLSSDSDVAKRQPEVDDLAQREVSQLDETRIGSIAVATKKKGKSAANISDERKRTREAVIHEQGQFDNFKTVRKFAPSVPSKADAQGQRLSTYKNASVRNVHNSVNAKNDFGHDFGQTDVYELASGLSYDQYITVENRVENVELRSVTAHAEAGLRAGASERQHGSKNERLNPNSPKLHSLPGADHFRKEFQLKVARAKSGNLMHHSNKQHMLNI